MPDDHRTLPGIIIEEFYAELGNSPVEAAAWCSTRYCSQRSVPFPISSNVFPFGFRTPVTSHRLRLNVSIQHRCRGARPCAAA